MCSRSVRSQAADLHSSLRDNQQLSERMRYVNSWLSNVECRAPVAETTSLAAMERRLCAIERDLAIEVTTNRRAIYHLGCHLETIQNRIFELERYELISSIIADEVRRNAMDYPWGGDLVPPPFADTLPLRPSFELLKRKR